MNNVQEMYEEIAVKEEHMQIIKDIIKKLDTLKTEIEDIEFDEIARFDGSLPETGGQDQRQCQCQPVSGRGYGKGRKVDFGKGTGRLRFNACHGKGTAGKSAYYSKEASQIRAYKC